MQRDFYSFDQSELHALRRKRARKERNANIAFAVFLAVLVAIVVYTTLKTI